MAPARLRRLCNTGSVNAAFASFGLFEVRKLMKECNWQDHLLQVSFSSLFLIPLLWCFPGGGRDLDGEPGAVLQALLWVHVQYLVIDSFPLCLSSHSQIWHTCTHTHVRTIYYTWVLRVRRSFLSSPSSKSPWLGQVMCWGFYRTANTNEQCPPHTPTLSPPVLERASWQLPLFSWIFVWIIAPVSASYLITPLASTGTVSLMPWISAHAAAPSSHFLFMLRFHNFHWMCTQTQIAWHTFSRLLWASLSVSTTEKPNLLLIIWSNRT